MKTLIPVSLAGARSIAVTLALGAVVFATDAIAAPESAGRAAVQRLADQAAPMPVTATFAKNASAKTDGPYVLTLKNTSETPITVSVRVDQDVTVHNRPKNRTVGPQEIAPGKEWRIDDLAALDKVTVSADGYESLTLTVRGD